MGHAVRLLGLLAGLSRGWGCCWFEVFIPPPEPALVAIFDEAGASEAVELAGINDELGWAAEGFESLVHLLTADERDVEIGGATHEKHGRVHSLVDLEERVAHFDVELEVLPRRSEFVVVLKDVLVDAVEGHGRGDTRTADSGFEAIGGGYGVIGEDAAIAPAGNGEAIGIGDAE